MHTKSFNICLKIMGVYCVHRLLIIVLWILKILKILQTALHIWVNTGRSCFVPVLYS